VTGTSTIIVQSKLVTYTSAEFRHDTPQWVNITMVSEFPTAWARFYNNTLIEEGFSSPADYTTTVTGNTITISIRNVLNFNMGYALVNVEIEEEVGGLASQSGLQNVVGLWHLNDDSGTTALDASAQHNDANLIDDPVWIAGPKSPALNFDGASDHGHVPYIPAYDCPNGITVMAMMRWTIDPATGADHAAVVSAGEHQWIMMFSGGAPPGPGMNEFFEFAVETDQGRNWSWSSTVAVPNVWYHITGVYDPVGEEIRLYVNGTLENTTAHNGTINVVGQGLTIANRWHSGAHDRWFTGDIDEIIIFDRPLTGAEIQRHYQSLKP
ncbi:MAG: LamG domain-containing protein, partial [Thermoplasmata archaeon]